MDTPDVAKTESAKEEPVKEERLYAFVVYRTRDGNTGCESVSEAAVSTKVDHPATLNDILSACSDVTSDLRNKQAAEMILTAMAKAAIRQQTEKGKIAKPSLVVPHL